MGFGSPLSLTHMLLSILSLILSADVLYLNIYTYYCQLGVSAYVCSCVCVYARLTPLSSIDFNFSSFYFFSFFLPSTFCPNSLFRRWIPNCIHRDSHSIQTHTHTHMHMQTEGRGLAVKVKRLRAKGEPTMNELCDPLSPHTIRFITEKWAGEWDHRVREREGLAKELLARRRKKYIYHNRSSKRETRRTADIIIRLPLPSIYLLQAQYSFHFVQRENQTQTEVRESIRNRGTELSPTFEPLISFPWRAT